MITFEHTEVSGFSHALRGMRNPLDSWPKSDSSFSASGVFIGPRDHDLAERLIAAGPEHATFLREIVCWVDITAPRFWWQEMDRYRVGKEQLSCSTMHRIMAKPFTDRDFAADALPGGVIADLNELRAQYHAESDPEKKRHIWRRLIERLPQSYLQRRTLMMSYQAIRTMVHQRRNHKLEEWHDFVKWAEALPHSWMFD